MTNQVTLQHGGAYEITLSRSGERGLVVEVFDMEEDASSVAPMTPAEWDCFVARGNKALGREQGPTVPRAGELAPDAEPLFYIWDTRSFVGDSILWWRPKSSGYTVNLDEAGTYTAAQCRGNRETDRPVPVEIARAVCSQHVIAGRLRRALEETGATPTAQPENG